MSQLPVWLLDLNKQTNKQIFILFKNSFEVLADADDLCVLCEGKNQLMNIIKIIEKRTILNK